MSTPILDLEYYADVPTRYLPQRIVDEWETTLKGARQRILDSLAKFLDPTTGPGEFSSKIADASSDAWEQFVNPNLPDADLLKLKQRVKLASAYDAWSTGVQNAFAPGGSFENNVTAKKPKFQENIKFTIGAVGFKPDPENWGPAVKVALLVTGDTRVPRYLTPGETLNGSPTNAFGDMAKYVRPTIISIYTYGAVLMHYALIANDATLISLVQSIVNGRLTKVAGLAEAPYTVTLELRLNSATNLPQVYGRVEHV